MRVRKDVPVHHVHIVIDTEGKSPIQHVEEVGPHAHELALHETLGRNVRQAKSLHIFPATNLPDPARVFC